MKKIQVNLKICTLYKGVPYGPSIIEYDDPDNEAFSFIGIGIFNQGKLDGAPFTLVNKLTNSTSYSKMENGRPANKSYKTGFFK